MSGRKLVILALILVVLGFAAYLPRRPSETQRGDAPVSGDELFANLDVNAIASVEINTDGKTSTISKKDDTWVVGSLYDYPADRSKIVEQLRGLKFLKIGQPVRGGDKMLDEFELGEDSDSIRFIDSAGTELATLRIGKARTPKKTGQPPSGPAGFGGGMPDGRYISTDGSNVILIDDALSTWVGSDDGWVKKQLLSVTGTDITTVTVSSNDTAYSLNFESGEAKLGDLAEDEKLDTGDAGRVRGALNYLSFDSIADPALSDEDTGMGNPITYRAKEKSGIVYELKIGGTPADSDDKRYARVVVSSGALPPPTQEDAEALVPSQPEPAEGSGDASETPTKPREELVQEELDRLLAEHQRKADETLQKVEELAGLGSWTYLLTKYSAESISMGREQLVEKIEEEEEAEAADGSSSGTGPAFTDGPVFTPAADTAEPGDQPAASESDAVAPPPPPAALPPIPTDVE